MHVAEVLLQSLRRYMEKAGLGDQKPESVDEAREILSRVERQWAAEPIPELGDVAPAAYLGQLSDPAEWRQLLLDLAEQDQFPNTVREAVAKHQSALIPLLVASAGDESLRIDAAPGKGRLPVLAANLLGELEAEAAVPTLLELAERVPEFTPLGDTAVEALLTIGESARAGLYQLAERHQFDVESVPYTRAVEILTRLRPEEQTWHWLEQGLKRAKEMAGFYAVLAGDYGDSRAVPHLSRLLMEHRLNEADQESAIESIELCGGLVPAAPGAAKPDAEGKVGRNDPCPCGSGKKYKKCCGK
ncbi:MAG: YecA family protein [Mycobacterium leprae]